MLVSFEMLEMFPSRFVARLVHDVFSGCAYGNTATE